jgi:hypothetical protein
MLETIQLCATISLFSNLIRTPLEGLARIAIKIIIFRMQNIFLNIYVRAGCRIPTCCKEKNVLEFIFLSYPQ